MKRIISIILCIAMLMSLAVFASSAVGENISQVTAKNVMSFTTDKESYRPGDTVTITARMDSIWGDASMTGDIAGHEGSVLPGAYGMNIINATLIFPLDIFTPAAGKDFKTETTITNMMGITPQKTSLADARKGGFYNFLFESAITGDGSYAFFSGSGDLCQFKLTVSADAANGTYQLPVGSYRIVDEANPVEGLTAEYEFFGQKFAWIGSSDSFFNDREVQYGDNGFVSITIEGGTDTSGGDDTTTDPTPVDPMSFEFSAAEGTYVPGDEVEVNLSVKNNEGLDVSDVDSVFYFDNTALQLISVSSPVDIIGSVDIDYDSINKSGSFEDLGKLTEVDCIFNGTGIYDQDGVIITLKFKVLPTAQSGDVKVTGISNNEGIEYPEAVITVAGNHTHSFTDNVTPATCTEQGYTDKTCSCGLTYRMNIVDALGHEPSTNPEDTITVPATCTTNGHVTTLCSRCGKPAKVVETDPLGHDFVESDVSATCTQDGYHLKKCTRCDYEEKSDIVPMLAHKYADGSEAWGEPFISKRPTTSSVGYMAKKCQICDFVWEYEDIPVLPINMGDCDMSGGKPNIQDVSILLKYIAEWDLDYFSSDNADVNHDTRINMMDVSKLLKYIAGWPNIDLEKGDSQM